MNNREKRIAMWSGPRNISTAMMRSWGNREDTFVCDEPFYAHYLKSTGAAHPGAAEVIQSQEGDWKKVSEWLTGPIPEGKTIFYQKHMSHHLLPDMGRDWIDEVTHCFLIRDPLEMLPSLDDKFAFPTLQDTGLPQQVELFNLVKKIDRIPPPILDSKDLLQSPKAMLMRLCENLNVPWADAMLSWPPGPRKTDGVWAKHWYHNVEKSTGFQPYTKKEAPLPEHLARLNEECQPYYQELYSQRIRV